MAYDILTYLQTAYENFTNIQLGAVGDEDELIRFSLLEVRRSKVKVKARPCFVK